MRITFLLLIIFSLNIYVSGQEIECYCFESEASREFKSEAKEKLQKNVMGITEWILIKGDSVAVVAYMDRPCNQPWAFFQDTFNDHSEKNRIYKIRQNGDSLMFTKIVHFPIENEIVTQEQKYNVKSYSDSLTVLVEYSRTKYSLVDMSGLPPERTYKRVYKE